MASSSHCFFIVSVAFLLQFLVVSASALNSTKYIDKLCQIESINDKTFCLQTLSAYPPATNATGLLPLAKVVIRGIALPYAKKSVKSADKAVKKMPALKTQLKACKDAFYQIEITLINVALGITIDPSTTNYDVMLCTDETTIVTNLIGKNKDSTSKSLMKNTVPMNQLISLAVAATVLVGG